MFRGDDHHRQCGGIERRELRSDLEMEIAVDLLLSPIYYRLLMSGEPLTNAYIDRLVRAVMAYGRENEGR
jgi:hypothetical protein